MRGRNPARFVGWAVLALVIAAGPGRAGSYHDETHHFTVDLPAGWDVVPPRESKVINALLEREYPGLDISFVAVFRPIADTPGQRPCVLVQVDTEVTPGISFDDFAKDLDRDYRAAVGRSDREADLRRRHRLMYCTPTFDRERKRFHTIPPDDRYPHDGPSVQGAAMEWTGSYGYFGPDKLVLLHTVGGVGITRPYAKLFAQMSESFRFDEPAPPADARPAWSRLVTTPTGEVARPVVIGGAVGVVILVFGALVLVQRRAKPSRAGF